MSLYIVKAKKTKLKAGLSATALQVTLDELVDSKGNPIVTASFGEWFVLVVKQSDQVEMIKCTAVTQNGNGSATCTVDPLGRNLDPIFPFTGTASSSYTFLAGAEVIVTNDPLTVMSFANKHNDETVEGLWTFNQTPLGLNAGAVNDASTTAKGIGRTSSDPTVTLGTVTMTIASPAVFTKTTHGLTVNDMVKFTTTVSLPTGIVAGTTYYVIATGLTANDFQLSTSQGGSAINTSGSQSGVHTLYKNTPVFMVGTDYRIGSNSYGVDSGTANAHVLTLPTTAPTSYIGGDTFSYRVNVTNTTATTVNVAGLGVKTIKKLNGTTDLVAGDLVAGMIIEIEYNEISGFFMLKTPVANVPATPPALTDVQAFTTAGSFTWTKPAGAKWVEVTVIGGGGAGGSGTPVNNVCGGGGGGWGFKKFDASALGATEDVVVGAGGVAGANNTAGGAGGFSKFGTTTLLRADGGSGGAGNTSVAGGSANGDINFTGGASGNSYSGAGPSISNSPAPRGGGNGGYNGGSPATATAGGAGGGFTTYYVLAGGTAGPAGVNNGGAGNSPSTGYLQGGTGGGGGGYNGNGTNTGGNGGAGAFPGGGGGGSVGTNNVGGNGARGMVYVVTYF